MTQPITTLARAYTDQPCYIVGKGPSLVHLKPSHFGEPGPIIAMNQAIRKVEAVAPWNSILSMQKDGAYPIICDAPCEDCTAMGPGDMWRPWIDTALLVSKANSQYCFPDHPIRYLFDTEQDLGLVWSMPSIVVAIRLAELFGCSALVFVSCDIHTTGDRRTCADGLETVELQDGGMALVDLPKLVDGLLRVSRIRDVTWVTPS